MGRTKEKATLLKKYGERKFGDKTYKLVNILDYKKQAKRSATQRRVRGNYVRVVPINDCYAVYSRKKKKRKRRKK